MRNKSTTIPVEKFEKIRFVTFVNVSVNAFPEVVLIVVSAPVPIVTATEACATGYGTVAGLNLPKAES